MARATSALRPPAMVPAGPPTRGNPIVEMTASTLTAPGGEFPAPFSPAEVSASRTTVCASTPLIKMGTGTRPSFSSRVMRWGM